MTSLILMLGLTVGAACGGSAATDQPLGETGEAGEPEVAADASAPTGAGSVSPALASATIADGPDDLVVLDVRTPEEYATGHLDGAQLLDFYDPGFAAALAELDPAVPYVVYCRSGNRSGQTLVAMDELGFESVVDIDGGIVAWAGDGFPVER